MSFILMRKAEAWQVRLEKFFVRPQTPPRELFRQPQPPYFRKAARCGTDWNAAGTRFSHEIGPSPVTFQAGTQANPSAHRRTMALPRGIGYNGRDTRTYPHSLAFQGGYADRRTQGAKTPAHQGHCGP